MKLNRLERLATDLPSTMPLDEVALRCPGSERIGGLPSPKGLAMGIGAAFLAQLIVIVYHYFRMHGIFCRPHRVQIKERSYEFWHGVKSHLSNPGGILMMVAYLIAYWMFDLMPCSYYSYDGGVRFWIVFAQIVCQDFFMFIMHGVEHISKRYDGGAMYRASHKPHHRFTNPRIFDAFDGSIPDTFTMILIPLFITSRLLAANVWEYMLFGSIWSAWLCLIHSEFAHPWDPLFSKFGFGTAADHHVHHKVFVYNYGHTFMWWDMIAGTYRRPDSIRGMRDFAAEKKHDDEDISGEIVTGDHEKGA